MQKLVLPLALGLGLGVALPAMAQEDLGNIVSGVAQALIAQELDKNAFAAAQSSNTAAGYQNYLQQFPQGAFRSNAERALAERGQAVAPEQGVNAPAQPSTSAAAQTEARLGLGRNQRRQIQIDLSNLGFDTRGSDGLWGNNTRKAIARWQEENAFAATGYVTAAQIERIGKQARGTGGGVQVPAQDGDAALEEKRLALSLAERREMQLRLTVLGFDTRGTDGTFGANTRRALSNWQRDRGETETGYVTADQLRTLRRLTGG